MPTPERPLELEVRRATEADLPAALDLAQRSLGWSPDDPNEAFFRWKHLENPAGASPMWVALDDGEVVGFRVFLRWRFIRPGAPPAVAVRAVDTATHPDHQGRGIFRRLTLGAVDELRAEGVDFVFNTPNSQSRPGYLKMGWQVVGRVPIAVRPSSLVSLHRIAGARTSAGKWSQPSTAGTAAIDALADDAAVTALLDSQARPAGLATDRTVDHLRWRYRFGPLHYRAIVAPDGPAAGLAVFRVRDRARRPRRSCARCSSRAAIRERPDAWCARSPGRAPPTT